MACSSGEGKLEYFLNQKRWSQKKKDKYAQWIRNKVPRSGSRRKAAWQANKRKKLAQSQWEWAKVDWEWPQCENVSRLAKEDLEFQEEETPSCSEANSIVLSHAQQKALFEKFGIYHALEVGYELVPGWWATTPVAGCRTSCEDQHHYTGGCY